MSGIDHSEKICKKDVEKNQVISYHDYFWLLIITRGFIVCLAAICVYHVDLLQRLVERSWDLLLSSWVFNSVYFETWFTTFTYAVIIHTYPVALRKIPALQRFKIHSKVDIANLSPQVQLIQEAVWYVTPLMILDTFVVKKYCGVDPKIWIEKSNDWIQITRALPNKAPSVIQVIFQLVISILLYDAIFFFIHLILHKNLFLYKYVHAYHHDHGDINPFVTNQLTVSERLVLVLSANFCLKIFSSHPLTRTIFVPIFVFLLIDNHTGYDLPIGLHRLVPFDIIGGPVKHTAHHTQGSRCYQPFLTYLDKLLDKGIIKV
ncbi:hypothetical protein CHS0354_004131 [Potamilus streckersoni]|uniref:Fatty acid hydroxylase domain-containing protein n=1 Tax=Potamilus streckersoni TaxID=2493646 RepID=A0AAE0VWV1_9BIVA|nr:hypothetical protein CHS0354_004131 [Potamilus streckersoni]